ncbi:MAG TPA: hypothetical protein VL294_13320 [Pseudolysinimonas sp.]|jgi:hypothetical protein|nr:hypothetical protein [Pseudolysinimonas sp.]
MTTTTRRPLTAADFERFAAVAAAARAFSFPTSRPVIGLPGREPARTPPPGNLAPPAARLLRGGRVPAFDPYALTADERRELNMIALGELRLAARRDEARQRVRTVARLGARVSRTRERSLVASVGMTGGGLQPWEGIIGAEGRLTGDGRMIELGALTAGALPLPLRYAPADLGAHEGAVLVGRIEKIDRAPDGLIHASGVLDLGSPLGREATRLIRAGMLGGVSMDLDSTSTAPRKFGGQTAAAISTGRVRAATLVAIPAFVEARIWLVDDTDPDAEDCGCDDDAALIAFDPINRKA